MSPTFSATPLATPQAFSVDVLDANLAVVSHITLYGGAGSIASVGLSASTYVPETDGSLVITANQGAQGHWGALGLDNATQLPNGFYRVRVTQAGSAPVYADFWIKHSEYGAGSLVVLGGVATAGGSVNLGYSYPEAVALEVRVYNLAGELVSQGSSVGTAGVMSVALRSASGRAVASGIYLVQVRGTTVNGGSEFLKLLKVAVTR